jgi:UDP-glucose 4-epimerase
MGYIGSHTAVVLAKAGQQVVLYDNLCNSKRSVFDRLEKIAGPRFSFIEGDVRDSTKLKNILTSYQINAVFHFAGLKAVAESVEKPIEYYDNNVNGTISVLKAMCSTNVKTLVFSSSATVYGEPQYLPLDEKHPTNATSPYGRSKLQVEEILADTAKSDANWRIACLRYFNPVGAHKSGLIGEAPNDIPNNLMPYIVQVASGERPRLNIFGNDYNTKDGTGVRDYIHVMNLAEGHKAALVFLGQNTGWHAINLGTGTGHTVLEMVQAFKGVSGQNVPYQIVKRRAGDVAIYYAKVDKAHKQLSWQAEHSLEEMCASTWNFYLTR